MPDEPPAPLNPADLLPVTEEEITDALSYALRFDDRGKPNRTSNSEFMAVVLAKWLTRHLLRSNLVVMRKKPAPPHSTG